MRIAYWGGVCSLTSPAFADGEQKITLSLSSGGYLTSQVTTDYILTIPQDFNITTNGWNNIGQLNVKVSQDKVFTGSAVVVTAESANSFYMKAGDNSISYDLTNSLQEKTTTFTFASNDINGSTYGSYQDVGIYITWNSSQTAGDYTDTITYTATVEGADAEESIEWTTVDLSGISAAYQAQHGDMLTGTLGSNVQISIADGATVTLSGVNINGSGQWDSGQYAGISCEGDSTIILSGTNTVKGFFEDYPGIQVPVNKTLTIKGSGSLTASSNGYGAGIGGGYNINCGNIKIEGGTITATGGENAAGIGGGNQGSCGDITIASTVTSVTATSGASAPSSIGAGSSAITVGTVTIEDESKVTQN